MSITRTDTNGNTTTYADKSALQSFNRTYNSTHASVGGSVPLRNDLQANGGAGYNTLSRMSTSGSINPDSVQAGSAGTPGSLSLPTSNVVNSLTLKPTTGLNLPTKQDTIIPSVQPATSLEQQKTDAESQSATDFQKYLDALTAPPSSADSYRKAQKETGILQKQDAVNNLTSQLNQIVAQGQASQLQVVGQGRGIPEAIIGGQQAQIARETAIQALPVSAQLAAAQGNLQMAEQNLNTLFKIYSDDAKNKYDYKTKINEAVYNFTTKQNQNKIDDIQKKLDREYTEKQDSIKQQQDYSQIALKNNQGGLAAQFMALKPDSPTYQKDFSSLVSKISDPMMKLDIQLKNLQITGQSLSNQKQRQENTTNTPAPTSYTVKSSDKGGLFQIAQQLGVDFEALKAANPQLGANFEVKTGYKIKLPNGGGASGAAIEALNIILGSGKFTKEQAASVTSAVKNGQDPLVVLKNTAKNQMTGANATKIEAAETSRDAFNALSESLQDYYAAGGKTSLVSGSFVDMYKKFGELKDPKLTELAVQIQGNIQSYRNAISGTAYSEQEGKDIASIFPGINRSEGLNNAIISGRKKLFDSVIDAQYRGVLGTSYDILKSNSSVSSPIDNYYSNATSALTNTTPQTQGALFLQSLLTPQ